MGGAALVYSLPRVRAQNSSTSNPAGAGAMSSANTPIVIAQGVAVRSLALDAAGASAADGNSGRPAIYFTATQMPNRVMALAGAAPISSSASNAGNDASAMSAGEARGALNATVAQAEAYTTVAGSGAAGSLGDGGAATAAQLNLQLDSPYMRSGVAVAPDGTIFIADTKNATIRRISPAAASDAGVIASVAGKWGPGQNVQLVEPMGLALDRAGNLYIADHGANAVIEVHDATAATPGRLEVLAHIAQAAMVAVTADGRHVFVAAPEADTAVNFDTRTRQIWKVFVGGKFMPSSPAETANNSSTVCRSIDKGEQPCPWGIAVDGRQNIFVSDPTGNKIARIDGVSGMVTAAASGISAPGEMAFDADGNLFVAEQGRNRIVEIKGLGAPVASVTLTPPPAPVPPAGVPCPAIVPPPGFAFNTNFCAEPLAGTTPPSAFTVTNNTNADVTGLTWTTIGLNPTDFVVASTSCTPTLHAGMTCALNVGFAPTGTGTRTATLAVNYTGATQPLAASLAGTGDDYQLVLADGQLTQISVAAGNTGTFMMQVVPDNIFTGTVNFICPGKIPANTTCTFTPPSVSVTAPGMAVPFSVAFQTTSRVPTKNGGAAPEGGAGASGASLRGRSLTANAALVLATIAILVLMGALRWRTSLLRAAAVIVLALGVAAILEGCHGGSGNPNPVGTPAGSYTMTVQATTQSAPRGITITLDVE